MSFERAVENSGLWSAVSLAVSASIVSLFFNSISLTINLDWDIFQEGLGIFITTSAVAIVIHQTRWEEKRALRKIKKVIKEQTSIEKFILHAAFLFRTWETMIEIEARHDQAMLTQTDSVLRGNHLQKDLGVVKLGYSSIVVSACLILNLPLVYSRAALASFLVDSTVILFFVIALVWITVQTVILFHFLDERIVETSKRAGDLVKYQTLKHYLLTVSLLESTAIVSTDNGKKNLDPTLEFISSLDKLLEPSEQAILMADWPMFRARFRPLSSIIERRSGQLMLFEQKPRLNLTRELQKIWRKVVVVYSIENSLQLEYLRHLAIRLLKLGPAQLQSDGELANTLRLNPDEVRDVHRFMATFSDFEDFMKLAEDYEDSRHASMVYAHILEERERGSLEMTYIEMEKLSQLASKYKTSIDPKKIQSAMDLFESDEFRERTIEPWDEGVLGGWPF